MASRARAARRRPTLRPACALALAWALSGAAAADAPETPEPALELPAAPFSILGHRLEAGTGRHLEIPASQSFSGAEVAIPVRVVHGRRPGSVLCLTAGVHGDEVNGVEVVRRTMDGLDAGRLAGTVVGVPIVNLHGYRRGSRYLPDRRDLNRHFPGRRAGSTASRIAHAVFEGVIRHCDRLLDFHTGSFQRTNLPHVRADLRVPGVEDLVGVLSGWIALHHPGRPGTLRRAATDSGIPTLTFEVGEPVRLQEDEIRVAIAGVDRILAGTGMVPGAAPRAPPTEVFHRSRWVRVDEGGLLFNRVGLGARVETGQVLGIVMDPLGGERQEVRAPEAGRVIGMAWSQVVIPGFAAFHLALAGPPGAEGADPAAPDRSDEPDLVELDERPE